MTEYNGYNIYIEKGLNLYKIKNKGSGPAPKVLSGMYTSTEFAQKAIDSHVEKSKKGIANGTSKGSGTG